jgi:hypothetical protein
MIQRDVYHLQDKVTLSQVIDGSHTQINRDLVPMAPVIIVQSRSQVEVLVLKI